MQHLVSKSDNFLHLHLKIHFSETVMFLKTNNQIIFLKPMQLPGSFYPPNINHLSGHMPYSLVDLHC